MISRPGCGFQWHRSAAFVLFLVALCSCSTPSLRRDADSEALRQWVEADLGPYLVAQLGDHPRFKGAPILVVKMVGADVQPEMDELTASIRAQLMDILFRAPSVHLAWRPTQPPWEHHRTLAQVQCRARHPTQYYVGIETRLSDARELEVSVRALDLREGEWVRGVGRSWRGRASLAQVSAFHRQRTDRYLRGLRVLPFAETQVDLAAAYLAQNLSCLLQQRASGELTVYPEVPKRAAPVLKKSVALVGNYLARFREVKITANPEGADVVLRGELHPIDGELHQLWIVPQFKGAGEHLPGVDTDTYLRVAAQTPGPVAVSRHRRTQSGQTRQPKPATPLLADFRLLTPSDPTSCGSTNPWASGAREIAAGERLSLGRCYALEVAVARPASLFLVSHDSSGRIIRLLPNSCARGVVVPQLGAGQRVRFPRSRRLLELDGTSVEESFYAIAVTDPRASRRLSRKLEHLPGLCAAEEVATITPGELEHWLARMERSVSRYGADFDWRALRFRHRHWEASRAPVVRHSAPVSMRVNAGAWSF